MRSWQTLGAAALATLLLMGARAPWTVVGEARPAAVGDPGFFIDSGQPFAPALSRAVALGDLDSDGDLDAFVVNIGPDMVWFNDGWGRFTDSGQRLGNDHGSCVALGDLNGDGYLDALVGSDDGGPRRIWLNDGTGRFTLAGQAAGFGHTQAIALGHLDGGEPGSRLDAFIVNGGGPVNYAEVWLQGSIPALVDSGQALGWRYGHAVALGDLDDDGDLDAFVGNRGGNQVWINDGNGLYASNGQSLGDDYSYGVALADVDGDGDLDAYVANERGAPDRLYLNDGTGQFTDSGLLLGMNDGRGVGFADLNGDGYPDAFVAQKGANWVWFWSPAWGGFMDSGQRLGAWDSRAIALGDLDGDGDLDAFVVNYGQSNKVWLNSGGEQGGKPLARINFVPVLRK